ncbi:uncharacterized protein LOC115630540 [Scaptodrosophila lebanonensis]|uniref:Uncharacterized protein LOC115630540 n=1 Tax=Drosophila lebanonensis TaxID=7225 RepID=A0A6J2U2Y4_DROLE|nr:uncharacterized protein LOC115630540 [Scaptodrosophila lebanonensis]
MDFVTAISTGADIEYTVHEYAYAFLQALTSDPHNWCTKVSYKFVGQCFNALGIRFMVSMEAFAKMPQHPYRNDNLDYVFNSAPFVLQGLHEFLNQLPTLLATYDKALTRKNHGSNANREFNMLTRPLPCYLRVVSIWCKVVDAMSCNGDPNTKAIDKFLREPLARVSYSILLGLSKLLPDYGMELLELPEFCRTLTINVRFGIFYEETHNTILKPMLRLFRKYSWVFCGVHHSALNFIYCVFCVKWPNNSSYERAYKFLKDLLTRFARNQLRDENGNLLLRILTDELISDKFVAIQFHMLRPQTDTYLLMATLKYLLELQNHITSTEIFPISFLERILQLVLQMPQTPITLVIRELAAELYISLVHRQYDVQEIVLHVLKTFSKMSHGRTILNEHEHALTVLMNSLQLMIQYCSAMQNFAYYISILNSTDIELELRLLATQFIYALFVMHTKKYGQSEDAQVQIHELLLQIVEIIEGTHQQEIRALLFSLFDLVDFNAIAEHNPENILISLERFCLDKFLHDESLSESDFYTLYASMIRSVRATGNEQIHTHVVDTLRDEHTNMQNMFSEQLTPSPGQLQTYFNHLRRLNVLIRRDKLPRRLIREMYPSLASNIPLCEGELAALGCETLAYMLCSLCKGANVSDADEEVRSLVKDLSTTCVREMSEISMAATTTEFKRAKSFYSAIALLLLCQQTDACGYSVLVEHLAQTAQIRQTFFCSLTSNYMQEMYLFFQLLHASEHILLPSNKIWKLLQHYKMHPSVNAVVTQELKNLIGVLIKHRLEMYATALPVVLLHICTENSNKSRVTNALRGHVNLINQYASAKEAWLLKVHIFTSTLKLIVKSLAVRIPINDLRNRNRLSSLPYLMPLVSQLRLKRTTLQEIAHLLCSLQEQVLCASEMHNLDAFISQMSAHKYHCEEDCAMLAQNSKCVGHLKPEPPGPIGIWFLEPIDCANATQDEPMIVDVN